MESCNTFLELGDQTKVLPRGRAVNVPIVIAGSSDKTDLTVCSPLHEVDLVLGMICLQEADPAFGSKPIDSVDYWYSLFSRLYFIIAEDHRRVDRQAGQSGNCQGTLHK